MSKIFYKIIKIFLLSIFILGMCFLKTFTVYAQSLPTTSPSPAETAQLEKVIELQISLLKGTSTTTNAQYVNYKFSGEWYISSTPVGLNQSKVTANLAKYYQKMKEQKWEGTFSYSDVNHYEIITNNLKNKTEAQGLEYLLGIIKNEAGEALTWIKTEKKLITGKEIKQNPNNYSIDTASSKLKIGQGSAGTTSPTSISDIDKYKALDDTGGGNISMAGGLINLTRPSKAPFGNFNQAFNVIFDLVIGISGTIFIIMLLVGGYRYIVSLGNEEEATKAKKVLINAGIGIVIVAITWVAGTWILNKIGIGSSTPGPSITVPTSLPPTYGIPVSPQPTSTEQSPIPLPTQITTPTPTDTSIPLPDIF